MYFFFNDTATTEIYTLSLHDALPISGTSSGCPCVSFTSWRAGSRATRRRKTNDERGMMNDELKTDRKSTRLNSSHDQISYAVFCLKKKKTAPSTQTPHSSAHKHDPMA